MNIIFETFKYDNTFFSYKYNIYTILQMSKSGCSTVINVDNSRNVNVLSNNTLNNIKVVVKSGVDVVVKGVRNILTFGR